jgi:hypothetical protein
VFAKVAIEPVPEKPDPPEADDEKVTIRTDAYEKIARAGGVPDREMMRKATATDSQGGFHVPEGLCGMPPVGVSAKVAIEPVPEKPDPPCIEIVREDQTEVKDRPNYEEAWNLMLANQAKPTFADRFGAKLRDLWAAIATELLKAKAFFCRILHMRNKP